MMMMMLILKVFEKKVHGLFKIMNYIFLKGIQKSQQTTTITTTNTTTTTTTTATVLLLLLYFKIVS